MSNQLNEMEMKIMQLIIHSGDAKSHAYEALRRVNEGEYVQAEEEMKLAQQASITAHNAQTALLQQEAAGEKMEITALFVHAQDHLMTSMTEINLIEQIIELRKIINTMREERPIIKEEEAI